MPSYDHYTEVPKGTGSSTIVTKGTQPTTTISPKGTGSYTQVEKPYGIGLLSILAQDGVEITCENGIVLDVQGTI